MMRSGINHREWMQHTHILFDPLRTPADQWRAWPCHDVVPKPLEAQKHLLPKLIGLTELSERDRVEALGMASDWSPSHGDACPCDALLISEVDTPQLAAGLALRMLPTGPQGERMLLRFHDPRVIRHMPWLLDAAQQDALLGCIKQWSYPQGDGTWARLVRDQPQPLSRLRLTEAQWATLLRMGVLNRALSRIAAARPDLSCDPRSVDTLLVRAGEQDELPEPDDWLLYAEQALTIHPHIHRHPQVRERIALARSTGVSYASACADLDMQAIEDDMRSSGVPHGL